MKKLIGKTTWFKKRRTQPHEQQQQSQKGGGKKKKMKPTQVTTHPKGSTKVEKEPSSILFVKRTPRGALATALKEDEETLSKVLKKRVKIVERNGTQLQHLLTRSDPWAGADCGRPSCTVCCQEEEVTPNCRQSNITYRTVCRLCKQRGDHSTYIGESSRSLYERQKEHVGDFRTGGEKSHMYQHLQECHMDSWAQLNLQEDGWRQFKVETIKAHRSAFIRQLHEAVTIMIEPGRILNSEQPG